jgi:hypothetical protein
MAGLAREERCSVLARSAARVSRRPIDDARLRAEFGGGFRYALNATPVRTAQGSAPAAPKLRGKGKIKQRTSLRFSRGQATENDGSCLVEIRQVKAVFQRRLAAAATFTTYHALGPPGALSGLRGDIRK